MNFKMFNFENTLSNENMIEIVYNERHQKKGGKHMKMGYKNFIS